MSTLEVYSMKVSEVNVFNVYGSGIYSLKQCHQTYHYIIFY